MFKKILEAYIGRREKAKEIGSWWLIGKPKHTPKKFK